MSFKISDIPVTPPSMKEFGIKKPFRPKPAENTPKRIKIQLLIMFFNDTYLSETSLSYCKMDLLETFEYCFRTDFTIIYWNKGFIGNQNSDKTLFNPNENIKLLLFFVKLFHFSNKSFSNAIGHRIAFF